MWEGDCLETLLGRTLEVMLLLPERAGAPHGPDRGLPRERRPGRRGPRPAVPPARLSTPSASPTTPTPSPSCGCVRAPEQASCLLFLPVTDCCMPITFLVLLSWVCMHDVLVGPGLEVQS